MQQSRVIFIFEHRCIYILIKLLGQESEWNSNLGFIRPLQDYSAILTLNTQSLRPLSIAWQPWQKGKKSFLEVDSGLRREAICPQTMLLDNQLTRL